MAAKDSPTTIVSTKGQVILPKSIRDRLRWTAGTKLTVEETADGIVLKNSPLFPATNIDDVFGSMRSDRKLSIADMRAAVAQEAKKRARD